MKYIIIRDDKGAPMFIPQKVEGQATGILDYIISEVKRINALPPEEQEKLPEYLKLYLGATVTEEDLSEEEVEQILTALQKRGGISLKITVTET